MGGRNRVPGQGPARGVERLSEIVRGGRPAKVGPEKVHYLLAVEAVTGGESEQLDQGSRLPEPPRTFVDGSGSTCIFSIPATSSSPTYPYIIQILGDESSMNRRHCPRQAALKPVDEGPEIAEQTARSSF
jgi:hypothetical protein